MTPEGVLQMTKSSIKTGGHDRAWRTGPGLFAQPFEAIFQETSAQFADSRGVRAEPSGDRHIVQAFGAGQDDLSASREPRLSHKLTLLHNPKSRDPTATSRQHWTQQPHPGLGLQPFPVEDAACTAREAPSRIGEPEGGGRGDSSSRHPQRPKSDQEHGPRPGWRTLRSPSAVSAYARHAGRCPNWGRALIYRVSEEYRARLENRCVACSFQMTLRASVSSTEANQLNGDRRLDWRHLEASPSSL